jgi:hypothetical protein
MIFFELVQQSTGDTFALHEFLRALVPQEQFSGHCSGRESADAMTCLNRISSACRTHLASFLQSGGEGWDKIASALDGSRRQYTAQFEFGALRDRANAAWERKDWDEARKFYEQSEPILSDVERKRLEFNQRRMAKGHE